MLRATLITGLKASLRRRSINYCSLAKGLENQLAGLLSLDAFITTFGFTSVVNPGGELQAASKLMAPPIELRSQNFRVENANFRDWLLECGSAEFSTLVENITKELRNDLRATASLSVVEAIRSGRTLKAGEAVFGVAA
jgi:hypothetical protein